jgi:hypothetical protein
LSYAFRLRRANKFAGFILLALAALAGVKRASINKSILAIMPLNV